MLYNSAQEWRDAPHKRIVLFAMSGLGKTYVSEMLQQTSTWFHYSIDYRIGTRYMAEPIADNCKREAMKVPFLREMLLADAIHIAPNIHDHDLTAVAAYTGKPGNEAQGGLSFDAYMKRQKQFEAAETQALLDTSKFMERAEDIYGYDNFVCDTGGSICEWVDAADPNDPILNALAKNALLVWIKGSDAHSQSLVERFDSSPKPMCYDTEFTTDCWETYLSENNILESEVNPDGFIRWMYARAMKHRQPRYEAMAKWGVTLDANDVMKVRSADDFCELIAAALS
jgi:hypothetical protein